MLVGSPRMTYEHNCVRCGGEWTGYVEFPEKCKHCGIRAYDVPAKHTAPNLLGTHTTGRNPKTKEGQD